MLLYLPLLSASIATVSASDGAFSGPIAGCDEVSCPVTSAGDYDTCTVLGDTFQGIGLVRINGLPSSLAGLSLVKGAGVPGAAASDISSSGGDSEREFKSVYYLAKPSSTSASSLSGCVAIFHGTEGTLRFDGSNVQSSTGQCIDVIEKDCIDALKKIATESADESDSCKTLGQKLSDENIDACKNFAGRGRGLGHFTTIDVSDLSPISQQRNQSSDCWPVVPKDSSLSYIDDDVATVRNRIPEVAARWKG